ncbi:MAG: PorP/SprF family type IX secretion system membrane protein [Flavobacteriales bacterium]|nr:PorP/SprF family type IX secretion system membrane protein [Flavobacteriales bacterium]
MRRILLFVLLIIASSLSAQQISESSLLGLNLYDLNPSMAGGYQQSVVALRHRNQWVGWDGAPVWNQVSANGKLGSSPFGWGLRVNQESVGAFSFTNAYVTASYSKLLTSHLKIQAGLDLGASWNQLDAELLEGKDGAEAITGQYDNIAPQLNAGLALVHAKWMAGVKVSNIIENTDQFTDSLRYISERQINAHFLGKIKLQKGYGSKWDLRYAAQMRYLLSNQWAAEGQLGIWYNQAILIGGGYRTTNDAYAMLEYQWRRRIRIGYAYEFDWTDRQQVHTGTHDVFLSFLMGRRPDTSRSPRLFIP